MKPNVYTQIYIQLVFAVKNREADLNTKIRSGIFEYMSGILTTMKHKSLIVNGYHNHVHVFYGMNPNISVSDTAYELKRGSSLFINNNRLCPGKFYWQESYGGFSYSRPEIHRVYNYILDQENHHRRISFKEEYLEMLNQFEIEYNEKFLFEFLD
jgi:putative transposase